MKPVILVVAAALYGRDGRILIAQRPPGKHMAGRWEFPGGKVDAGESEAAALARELREELGIEVEINGLFDTVVYAYPEQTVSLKFFRCTWQKNEPRPLAVHDFAWVGRDQLSTYTFPAADSQLIQKLQTSVELWK